MLDAVIVGGGMGGLVAGLRATELGARVMVAEKGSEGYPCNSRMSGGNLHVARFSPYLPPDELRKAIDETTGGWIEPSLRDLIVDNAPRTLGWLVEHGAQVAARSDGVWEQCVLHPTRSPDGDRLEPVGRGPDLVLRRLAEALSAGGADLALRTEATDVLADGPGRWAVRVVTARGESTIATERVVFADGGFQANEALAGAHLGYADGLPLRRNAGTGQGFGLRTCVRLGAQTTSLESFYGCLLSADAMNDPSLSPYPMFDDVARAGVLLDRSGRRVADERLGGVVLANALARHPDKRAWAIIDGPGWERVADTGVLAPRSRLADLPSMLEAESLSELFHRVGLDAASLPPERDTLRVPMAQVLVTPPFRAFAVVPAVTYTMGGPVVDTTLTALDGAGRPIAGLALVGASAGGFDGGPLAGYTGGLLRAAISGLLWAEAAFG